MTEETFRWVITTGVGIAALCILVMAVVSFATWRLLSRFKGEFDEIKTRVTPIIETTRTVADQNWPKVGEITSRVQEIATNARDISVVARDQAHRWGDVGRDAADRTKAQVARMDSVVDETVEQVHVAGANVKEAVKKPIREASGVVAGIKAAVSTYAAGRRPSVDHATQDEEMFI